MYRSARSILALMATAFITTGAAHAQPPGPTPPQPLDADTRKGIVAAAADDLRARYVFPEVGDQAAARIEAQLAAGAYDSLVKPGDFANKLTDDLASVAHDKHLRIMARGAPPPPGQTPAGPPPLSDAGIVRADRLPGNIGYIEIVGFPPRAAFKPAYDRAMAALADTKALIIDARRHHGGALDGDAYVMSFFVPDDKKVAVNTVYQRKPNTKEFSTEVIYTDPTPTKYIGKPVYLLSSGETFSGGEALAYTLQSFKFAKVVGETTGGGANPGGTVPLSPDFAIFLPGGRPEDMVTHTNWEGKGVVPDIPTPRADALKVALEQLGQHPASGDVASLSEAKLFTLRDKAMPGTEAALRKMIAGLSSGDPPYDIMSEGTQDATHTQLAGLTARFAALGDLKSVTFNGPANGGGDDYTAVFAHGSLDMLIGLDADGKVGPIGLRPI